MIKITVWDGFSFFDFTADEIIEEDPHTFSDRRRFTLRGNVVLPPGVPGTIHIAAYIIQGTTHLEFAGRIDVIPVGSDYVLDAYPPQLT